jgi:hypothetical protein
MSGDTIRLSLPREPGFRPVALLVAGGVAARLDLTVETLEDLEIGVESLIEVVNGDNATLELRLDPQAISASVGPIDDAAVREQLADDAAAGVGLRRVLMTVSDGFGVVERDGMHWLSMEKRIPGGDGG